MSAKAESKPKFAILAPKNAREPLLAYHFLIKCFHYFAIPLVGSYFTGNWKWNLAAAHSVFMLTWSAAVYAFNTYEFRHDNGMFLSLIFQMYTVMCSQRFYKFIRQRVLVLSCNEEARAFTEKWEKRSEGYEILVWYLNLVKKLIVAGMTIFFSVAVFVSSSPIIYYVVTGKLKVAYPLYITYLDYTSHPGFEIHVVLHAFLVTCFATAMTPLVGFVLVTIVMICAKIDILCVRLNILSAMVLSENDPDRNSPKISELLREIYEDHQHLLAYTDHCEELFSLQHLVDHFVVAIQICLSLYSILKYNFYLGIAVITIGTFMLFTLDALGTVIVVKFEKLLDEIWNVPWYLLEKKNKTSYYFFLGNAQKVDRLSVGGRVPLSLNTFVQLYKRIYSYLMILLEMQN